MAKPKYTTTEDEITFNLLDTHTVDRLVKNGNITLPRKKVDVPKDEQWNIKQMSSRLLQGILNGDSIPKIANSLMDIIGNNEASAIRNARTMVTGAENSGRLDSYNDLAEKGVVQKKVWIATYDDRTRESHAEINGEEQDPDKVFSNGLMYPGDPDGDPSEVWNCRCSMKDHIIGFRKADGSISYVAGEGPTGSAEPGTQEETILAEYKALSYGDIQERLSDESKVTEFYSLMGQYSEGAYASAWKSYVEGTADPELIEKLNALLLSSTNASEQQEEAQIIETIKERIECDKLQNCMNDKDYQAFMDLVNEADNGELYREYADEIGSLNLTRSGGEFSAGMNNINFSYETHEGLSRYSTVAHEYNHFFDSVIGRADDLHFNEIDLINERCQIGSGAYKPIREWASASDEFLGALRQDMDDLKDRGINNIMSEIRVTSEIYNQTAGIQDALDGFFGTQAQYGGWGHGNRYYNNQFSRYISNFGHAADLKEAYKELGFECNSQRAAATYFRQYRAASEAWANVGSAVTCGGDELALMEKYMPNTVNAYREIVGGVTNE